MAKMKSFAELKAIRDQVKANLELRDDNEQNIKVLVGMATCGIAAGARATFNAMAEEVRALNLPNITFVMTGCMGSCYAEPTVQVEVPGEEPILYGYVDAEKGREIVAKHLHHGELVQGLIIGQPYENA
ncbi:MAG: (2Fe-2S) ferredoxin domain-containing protein [Saccharofermentanales bacterium]|jgi:NADP-reducing hydrogenase subunit HndB